MLSLIYSTFWGVAFCDLKVQSLCGDYDLVSLHWGFLGGSVVKNPPANAGDAPGWAQLRR